MAGSGRQRGVYGGTKRGSEWQWQAGGEIEPWRQGLWWQGGRQAAPGVLGRQAEQWWTAGIYSRAHGRWLSHSPR